MNKSRDYQFKAPALPPLYARAIMPATGGKQKKISASSIPALEATLTGARTDTAGLSQYRTICGFSPSRHCPITWPHILAFPLHIRLMTDPAFPLPLLGLVHLRNSITQHRAIHQGECLDLRCRLDNATEAERGLEFDIVTEARSSGSLVWEEYSTILFRKSNGGGNGKKSETRKPEMLSQQATITAPENIGRRYGRVSGDLNPIHIHAITARAFGFPRSIAHGMWSKARCLAHLQETGVQLDACRVQSRFQKPLLLPGSAILTWNSNESSRTFRLLNADASAPHLEGLIEPL